MNSATAHKTHTLRAAIKRFIQSNPIRILIPSIIVLNALMLGMETSSAIITAYGNFLEKADNIILGIFVLEISLRIIAAGPVYFFRGRWNLFDFLVIAVSLIPHGGELSILRTLRMLRVLRLISVVPAMRRVVDSLIESVYGVVAVAAILLLTFYIFSVLATHFYADYSYEYFGTIGNSMFTLFQIMTLASWVEIVRPLMQTHHHAWLFFVGFILITTFTIINLLVGVMVNTMQNVIHIDEEHYQGVERRKRAAEPPGGVERRKYPVFPAPSAANLLAQPNLQLTETAILTEISSLRAEMRELKQLLLQKK